MTTRKLVLIDQLVSISRKGLTKIAQRLVCNQAPEELVCLRDHFMIQKRRSAWRECRGSGELKDIRGDMRIEIEESPSRERGGGAMPDDTASDIDLGESSQYASENLEDSIGERLHGNSS